MNKMGETNGLVLCTVFTILLTNSYSLQTSGVEQTLLRCSRENNVQNCLTRSVVGLIDAVSYMGPDRIPLYGSIISLDKNKEFTYNSSISSWSQRNLSEEEDKLPLSERILNGVFNIFRSRSINVRLPEDWLIEEGRGSKKKFKKYLFPLLFAGFIFKATVLPIIVGKVSLIAGKALLVSMMALLLGLSINFKKSGGGRKQSSVEVINLDPHHHRRQDLVDGQYLAYRDSAPVGDVQPSYIPYTTQEYEPFDPSENYN